MVKKDEVKKIKKGDVVTRFWYTFKKLDLGAKFVGKKEKIWLESWQASKTLVPSIWFIVQLVAPNQHVKV